MTDAVSLYANRDLANG